MTRRPRVPEPLEPLDRNACRNCGWAVVLLARVGWVHDARSGLALPCLTPEPAYPRCMACRGKFATTSGDPAGVVVRHEVPGTGLHGAGAPCPGSLLLGTDPPSDAAAFALLWPPALA